VALVRTNVTEERVARISELGTTIAGTSSEILSTLIIEAVRCSETSVLTRVTQRHIPEDGILYMYCRLRDIDCFCLEENKSVCKLLAV
jgi:hypothetical protein